MRRNNENRLDFITSIKGGAAILQIYLVRQEYLPQPEQSVPMAILFYIYSFFELFSSIQ